MESPFDPYHKWLGIAPDEQPADHYRLLGIKRFERDPDVIESAADQRMAHVRTFQAGARSTFSQKILNELAAAKLCLLKQAEKAAYDQALRARQNAGKRSDHVVISARRPAVAQPLVVEQAVDFEQPAGRTRARGFRPHGTPASSKGALVGVTVALLIALGAVGLLYMRGGDSNSKPATARAPTGVTEPAELVGEPNREELLEPAVAAPAEPVDASIAIREPEPSDDSTPTPDVRDVEDARAIRVSADDPTPGTGEDTITELVTDKRESPPVREELAAKIAEVKALFKQEYVAAKKPSQRVALAQKALLLARDTGQVAERYALLQEAQRLAVVGLNPALALQVIDSTAELYSVDRLALAADMLEQFDKEEANRTTREQVVETATPLIGEAIDASRFPLARRLAVVALAAARKNGQSGAVKALTRQAKELAALEKATAAAATARQQLVENPDDRDAHLALGKYLCLFVGDWPQGLQHLQMGSDVAFAQAAKDESQMTNSPTERCKVGDAWWDLADSAKAGEQERLRGRAIYWYQLAAPGLTGFGKAKVDKRLAESAELVALPTESSPRKNDIASEAGDASRSQYVLPGGALLYLNFAADTVQSAGSTLTIRDLSGRHNDATTFGNVAVVRGPVGQALKINDGELRTTPSLSGLATFTLGAWVNLGTSTTDIILFEQGTPAGPSVVLSVGANLSVTFTTWNANGPPDKWLGAITKPGFISRGKWAYLTVRLLDGTAARGKVSLAVNGRSVEMPSQAVDAVRPTYVRFGGKGPVQFDEIVLFDRAISDAELAAIYRAGVQRHTLDIGAAETGKPSRK